LPTPILISYLIGVVSHNTVAELVDTSSGIHPRFSPYYIRTVRNDIKDPLAKMLIDQNVPSEPDLINPLNIQIFSFPKKSPETSVMRYNITALEQLEHYKMIRDEWCDHNPSTTIYVKPDEWLEVGAWVYKNWDNIGGLSFLPYTDHIYKQAPFQEISKEQYDEILKDFPEIDFSLIGNYEQDDQTTATHELACVAGACSFG
jgi:ribonucleoside-triphosphate reductase